MRFVIRDDDLNYFSRPADIERWYASIFAQHIPVGFSTIPFVKPTSDVYTGGAPRGDEEYPVSANVALVSYVKKNPLVEILQHGTTHETTGGVFEYARNAIPLTETKRGRGELEHAFEREVRIFVPPHDWIGSAGVYAVEAAGMDVIRGRGAGLRNLIPRWRYAMNFFRMLGFKISHALRGTVPAYPFVLDFGKHKEATSYRLEDADVFAGLAYAHQKGGIFVVVTHLHSYTPEKMERLLRLVEKARTYDAAFVPPSALFA